MYKLFSIQNVRADMQTIIQENAWQIAIPTPSFYSRIQPGKNVSKFVPPTPQNSQILTFINAFSVPLKSNLDCPADTWGDPDTRHCQG